MKDFDSKESALTENINILHIILLPALCILLLICSKPAFAGEPTD